MTSSKKENGANRDQDEIGELGSLFQKTYTGIVQIGSNFTICNVSAHSHCSHFNVLHIFSLRGGSRNLFSPSHNRILAPHLCISPTFPLCSCQSCPGETFQNIITVFFERNICTTNYKNYKQGIRESGDLPSWSPPHRRSPRSRCILHYPLCWRLWEDRHEDHDLRDSAARGELFMASSWTVNLPKF